MKGYVCIQHQTRKYFISEDVLSSRPINASYQLELQALADFVVEGETLIKSRYPLEDLIKAYIEKE